MPTSTTTWVLWHRDTFDRETPRSEEARGTGILGGLVELWTHTLSEGIDDSGEATFSSFRLDWGESAVEQISVWAPPSANSPLARLRRWTGFAAASDKCDRRMGEVLIQMLAGWHSLLLQESERWTAGSVNSGQESLRLLERIEQFKEPRLPG